ncbi:MAG: PD40 domain-containing protein [Chloroflexi bacterium]|nr:PD40 domain-containing protein [Chloroflexota bacterium]
MELSLLIYENREAVKEDWQLTLGEAPLPKDGRAVPDHISTWWNENVVVVVRASVGDIASDALDAFLALGEAAGAVRQLAYVGTDEAIWLVNADGSGLQKFAEDVCDGRYSSAAVAFTWSPTGDKLAVGCQNPDYSWSVIVLDEGGHPLARADGLVGIPTRWSPDGKAVAYQSGQNLTSSTATYEVRVLDLMTFEDRKLADNAWLLDWPSPHRLLVGLNVEDAGLGLNYDAHWLNIITGETDPITRFDDMAQFWLSLDASKAVVISPNTGAMLAVYDLQTGSETPIPDSVIGYPSHGIPARQFAFSPDGTQFYWADASQEPAVIYRANMDGSGLTRLGSVPSIFVTLSDEGLVAYPLGEPPEVVVDDLQTGARAEVGEVLGVSVAWRHTP